MGCRQSHVPGFCKQNIAGKIRNLMFATDSSVRGKTEAQYPLLVIVSEKVPL